MLKKDLKVKKDIEKKLVNICNRKKRTKIII